MSKGKCSIYRYASALVIVLGVALWSVPPAAHAGGVSFGVGVDLSPGYVPPPPPPPAYQAPPAAYVEPPEAEYGPSAPAMVQPAPPPVVVERTPPVVVERTPPVVYSPPVVVERRTSSYYYYYPSYHYSQRVETRTDYNGRSRYNEEYYEY